MTWTTPKTWTTEPLTSLDMNTHIRDNLNALKNPPTASVEPGGTVQNISATSFVDIPGTSFTLTTTGGDVMIGWCGQLRADFDGIFDVAVRFNGVDYLIGASGTVFYTMLGGVRLMQNVAAGSYTIVLRGRTNTGTSQIRLFQVWAREV